MTDLESKGGIFRSSGKKTPLNPELELAKYIGSGGEGRINQIDLKYVQKKVPGLVYKQFDNSFDPNADSGLDDPKERLKKILLVWERIKQVKKELQKKGETGFNIPKIVRGYISPDGTMFGLLLSNLEKNKEWKTFPLKNIGLLTSAVNQGVL